MTLRPVRPNASIRVQYDKRLRVLIDEMADSLTYWLRASYRTERPATIAQDASIWQVAFDKLAARWLSRFDDLAPKLSGWFAKGSLAQVEGTLKTDLRKAGFTVRFKPSKAMRDAYAAVIDENIGLIKSIGQQHLEGVRVALNQSVQTGRDLAHLTNALTKQTGITKRRAARIALDQNNRASAVMARQRMLDLGITKAKWLHSAGGKTPRLEHVAFSGKTFDLAAGHDFQNGEGVVWPGTAINCRCVMTAVIPGFD